MYLQGQSGDKSIKAAPNSDTPIVDSKYLTWNNIYSPTIDKELVASFMVSDSIPSDTKALLLHGLGVLDFEKELKAITELKELEYLSIMPNPSDNRFMPSGGYGQIDLQQYESNLEHLSSWISSLDNLKTLHIRTPSSKISQAIINCSKLKALYIERGKEFTIDTAKEIKKKNRKILPKLELLRIVDVPFELLPNEFSNLKIETLILIRTNGVPNFTYKLKKLKKLHIGGNSIEAIDHNITKLKSLEELSIVSIKIPSFPEEIVQLKKLRWLSLNWFENDTIPQSLLSRMNLSTLFLISPYSKKFEIKYPFKHLEYLYLLGIQNTFIDMAMLEKIRTLVLNNVGQVKFIDANNGVNKICHFQIFSESPREFTTVENWRNLLENIKSFKSISLFRVNLKDEQSNMRTVSINAKEALIDTKLFSSGIIEGHFKKHLVVECYEQGTCIYLTENQIENKSEKQKEFEYCKYHYNQDLIYRIKYPLINLSNGYAK